MKWLRKMFGGQTVDKTAREQIVQLTQELQDHKQSLRTVTVELFEVPELPPVQYLSEPLADRLNVARDEMRRFLAENAGRDGVDISVEEQRYLLMQMFFRGPMDHVGQQIGCILDSIDVAEETRVLPVVDIGCGRGELLQLLTARDFRAVGIDTSQLMVSRLSDQGFEARHGDAIGQLEEFPDDSLCGVTAFHMIEHVQPDYLGSMLRLAFQKMAPGGFLLLETPNPYCFESFSYFYTDDTHVRPIQPYQLAFLVETSGFVDSRAHFSAPVPASRRQELENWIRRYQNHGIIAYKPHLATRTECKAA